MCSGLGWHDLVLPAQTLAQLEDIALWLNHGHTLLHAWGLGRRIAPGHVSLFHGPSGTGKTLVLLEAMRRNGACQLLIMINRLTMASRSDVATAGENDPLIDRVFAYINTHIQEDLSLERLEEIFFFDSGTLTRRFKKQIGDTISQYIRKKRLNIAKNLLSEGSPPIEVYAQCGFVDYSGFFRAFKLQYGMSPKEFVKTKI